MSGEDFAGALRQIQEARSARPPWLAARAADVQRYEIQLYGRLHEDNLLRAVAELWLTVDRNRALDAVSLARQLHDTGSGPEAVLLLKAVLQRIPDYPPAAALLKAWSPAPAP